MYVLEDKKGPYIKNNVRYAIIREGNETVQDREQYALDNNFTLNMLSDFEIKKIDSLAFLKQWRQNKISKGFVYNDKEYQTRNVSDQINLMGVGLGALANVTVGQAQGQPPITIDFRTTDNDTVTLGPVESLELYSVMLMSAQTIWAEYNNVESELQQAQTIEELDLILNDLSL